jgi:hypothetical protein
MNYIYGELVVHYRFGEETKRHLTLGVQEQGLLQGGSATLGNGGFLHEEA